MCTEAEKKKYGFSLGRKVNFAGRHRFFDALLYGTSNSSLFQDVALALVLPPMTIYMDLRKNFCYGIGSLVSACIRFKYLYNLSKLMNFLVFVMKYLLSSHLFSSLLQISRHLHFFSPVNWCALNVKCLKSTTQPKLDKIKREFCLKKPMKLVNLSLPISMLSTHQTDCFQVMAEKHHAINSLVVHCFMMQLLILYGMRIKSNLELEQLLWLKITLINCHGNQLLLKFAKGQWNFTC